MSKVLRMWRVLRCLVLVVALLGGAAWGQAKDPTPKTDATPKTTPETPAPAPVPEETPALPKPSTTAPLRPVLDYLRFYETQPARVLPHVTERFRAGMAPQIWIEQARAMLAAQGYARLAWTVQQVDVTDTGAAITVYTRIRIDGQEILQQEIFTLVRTPEDEWLIDDWRVAE